MISHLSTAGLAELGWDESFADSFRHQLERLSDETAARAAAGRVLRRDRGACLVSTGDACGSFRMASSLPAGELESPVTGDFVIVSDGEVVARLDRRTAVMRASFRDLSAQVLAANVDNVLVASSLGQTFRPRRLERLLVIAWQTGAVPIVVLTKADTCGDASEPYRQAVRAAPGCSVHVVSALNGEGIGGLAAELAPRTTAVVIGPSGTGKSTLVNALSGGTADLATSPNRSDGKGRHTTVARELVRLANGALMIDTPGLRAIGLWDAEEALGEVFGDIEILTPECRFNDCAHETEPGCAVTAAIAAGQLDRERLESYRRLLRDQRRLQARNDARLRAALSSEQRARVRRLKEMNHR